MSLPTISPSKKRCCYDNAQGSIPSVISDILPAVLHSSHSASSSSSALAIMTDAVSTLSPIHPSLTHTSVVSSEPPSLSTSQRLIKYSPAANLSIPPAMLAVRPHEVAHSVLNHQTNSAVTAETAAIVTPCCFTSSPIPLSEVSCAPHSPPQGGITTTASTQSDSDSSSNLPLPATTIEKSSPFDTLNGSQIAAPSFVQKFSSGICLIRSRWKSLCNGCGIASYIENNSSENDRQPLANTLSIPKAAEDHSDDDNGIRPHSMNSPPTATLETPSAIGGLADHQCEESPKRFGCACAVGCEKKLAWEVLVIRRGGHGYYELPKGHVESGESLTDAAAREIKEETGLVTPILIGKFLTAERYIVRTAPDSNDHGNSSSNFRENKAVASEGDPVMSDDTSDNAKTSHNAPPLCQTNKVSYGVSSVSRGDPLENGQTLVKCVAYFRARSAVVSTATPSSAPTIAFSDGRESTTTNELEEGQFEFGPRESATTEVSWISLDQVDNILLKSVQVKEAIIFALTVPWESTENDANYCQPVVS